MPKRLIALIAVFLLAGNLYAGDPWKDKPYKQWDEKDVRKILTDSPWAKEVRVEATWRGTAGGMSPPSGASSGGGGGGGYGTGGGGMTGAGRAGEGEQGTGVPQASFAVRWWSSRAIRQAMARGAILQGTPEADAEQILGSDPPYYIVLVIGRDMTPFAKVDESSLKEKSLLVLKKNKAKVVASRVEIQHPRSDQPQPGNSSGVLAVAFYFPKKGPTGEAVLPADEKSVEFVCQAGGTSIRTSFDLQKMAGPQGLDW